MGGSNYRKVIAWQKSRVLAVAVYRATLAYPRSERFGLIEQMRRAAVSVPSNIAEGFGRGTHREIVRFLGIARGSVFELEAQLLISEDLEYLAADSAAALLDALAEIVRLLNGLITYYNRRLSA